MSVNIGKWQPLLDKAPLDILLSLKGFMLCISNKENPHTLTIENFREVNKKYDSFSIMDAGEDSTKRIVVVANALGYITSYLAGCCGRRLDPNAYFFNKSLSKLSPS